MLSAKRLKLPLAISLLSLGAPVVYAQDAGASK